MFLRIVRVCPVDPQAPCQQGPPANPLIFFVQRAVRGARAHLARSRG
jgi:hypothetical protein